MLASETFVRGKPHKDKKTGQTLARFSPYTARRFPETRNVLRILVRPAGRLRIYGAINDPAGNHKSDYRAGTGGALD